MEITFVSCIFNYCVWFVTAAYSNGMPGQMKSGLATKKKKNKCGSKSSFENSRKNVTSKCIFVFGIFDCFVLQQLLFVTLQ